MATVSSAEEFVVDGEHLGAFLREAQDRGAAVAHALARRLAGAHHDRDLILETHGVLDCDAAARSLWKFAHGHEPCMMH